jgi:hypothetical protein
VSAKKTDVFWKIPRGIQRLKAERGSPNLSRVCGHMRVQIALWSAKHLVLVGTVTDDVAIILVLDDQAGPQPFQETGKLPLLIGSPCQMIVASAHQDDPQGSPSTPVPAFWGLENLFVLATHAASAFRQDRNGERIEWLPFPAGLYRSYQRQDILVPLLEMAYCYVNTLLRGVVSVMAEPDKGNFKFRAPRTYAEAHETDRVLETLRQGVSVVSCLRQYSQAENMTEEEKGRAEDMQADLNSLDSLFVELQADFTLIGDQIKSKMAETTVGKAFFAEPTIEA